MVRTCVWCMLAAVRLTVRRLASSAFLRLTLPRMPIPLSALAFAYLGKFMKGFYVNVWCMLAAMRITVRKLAYSTLMRITLPRMPIPISALTYAYYNLIHKSHASWQNTKQRLIRVGSPDFFGIESSEVK